MIRFSILSLSLSACIALASFSHAQETNSPASSSRNSTAELVAPSIPAEPALKEPEAMIGELILVEDSADQVLTLLEQMTDKIILRRQDLPASKFTFNSRGELTKREAVLAIESLLTLNGIMLTDMGGRFMKAVPATNVNTHVPQMLAGSTLSLDPSQQIYAKLFKLDYLNATEGAAPLVQNLISQNSSILPFPKSNALLISDALINLQRIETILNEADTPQLVREQIKFVKLDYVQASEMQDRLENLIQGPLNSYLEGNTSVTADERTNQLILITHPGNLDVIMNVIESVDVDAAPLTGSEVFQLRQAKAEEVVPIIEDIISGQEEGREEDAKVARENERSNGQRTNNTGNNNNNENNGNNNTPPVPATAVASSGGTEANSSLQFSNFVGLSADERTNSIVAYGTQQDLKTLRELIEKIDIPLPQVLIEAVITQVTLSETQSSGLSSIGFTYNGSTNFFTDISAGTVDGLSFTDGTISLDDPSNFSLGAAITPTNGDSDTRVLSAPRIVVSHNEEGIINVSKSQPIITGSTNYNDSTSTSSTVEYRDIGIKLTVTPLIGADGTVQMVIEQTVENVVDSVTIDGNDQPVIGVREATSTISVKDGQIVVLGGLQENTGTDNNNYFPLVRRIPLIRNILGNTSENHDRTEIIIFIRPTVLENPDKADQVSKNYIEGASETEVIKQYIETSTTSDIYLKGSKFEEKTPKEESSTNSSKPRSLRR
ncbi:secretin N-terminal domain-containing protein [Coraliomargarita sp. SDUM461003]|uniref:Secretin N-terminal domain-containing protein n=1 Tax=Thalassobacterium maritimum TaxID=3041265 RepID=A0ABU1ATB6_9BACT|nr:secretin N-terminal domain-containing protein [Coraliomargarita sp. SDUM461003]MDQ8207417.1 secretin N-terminal domain-containing protein [Coraliomargarita sp. SDUM461003]